MYIPPVQRPAWRWPYNWAETCSCNYNLIPSNKIQSCVWLYYIYFILYFSLYSTQRGCLTWKSPASCSGRSTSVERHRQQFDRWLCGYQNRSRRFGGVKSLFVKAEIETGFIGRPVHSIVTTSTELPGLRRADVQCNSTYSRRNIFTLHPTQRRARMNYWYPTS
jgi:hypothetical protein